MRSVACCAVCYLLLGRHKSEQAMEGQPAGCVCAPLDCASRVGLPPNSPQTCRADTYMRIWHFIAACRHARRVTSQRRRPLLRLDRYICRQRACPPCMPIESVCRSPPLRRRTAWPFLCAEVPHSAVASRRPAAPAPVAWRARRMRDPCSGDAPDPQPSRATRPGSLGRSPGWDGAMCLPQPAYRVHSQQDVVNYPRRRPRCAD